MFVCVQGGTTKAGSSIHNEKSAQSVHRVPWRGRRTWEIYEDQLHVRGLDMVVLAVLEASAQILVGRSNTKPHKLCRGG